MTTPPTIPKTTTEVGQFMIYAKLANQRIIMPGRVFQNAPISQVAFLDSIQSPIPKILTDLSGNQLFYAFQSEMCTFLNEIHTFQVEMHAFH